MEVTVSDYFESGQLELFDDADTYGWPKGVMYWKAQADGAND